MSSRPLVPKATGQQNVIRVQPLPTTMQRVEQRGFEKAHDVVFQRGSQNSHLFGGAEGRSGAGGSVTVGGGAKSKVSKER